MGLEAIYRRPNTSKPSTGSTRIFPYTAEGSGGSIESIRSGPPIYLHTHGEGLPIFGGHHGLAQPVCADLLSNTLEADFCVEALEDALGKADWAVSTSAAFTGRTVRGAIPTTSLWSGCGGASSTRRCTWGEVLIWTSTRERPHQALDYTPGEVFQLY